MSIFEILRGLVTARLICLYRVHILSLCAMRDIQLRRFRTPQIADRVHSTQAPSPPRAALFLVLLRRQSQKSPSSRELFSSH